MPKLPEEIATHSCEHELKIKSNFHTGNGATPPAGSARKQHTALAETPHTHSRNWVPTETKLGVSILYIQVLCFWDKRLALAASVERRRPGPERLGPLG